MPLSSLDYVPGGSFGNDKCVVNFSDQLRVIMSEFDDLYGPGGGETLTFIEQDDDGALHGATQVWKSFVFQLSHTLCIYRIPLTILITVSHCPPKAANQPITHFLLTSIIRICSSRKRSMNNL